ncbi:NAD(P)/FAD-dependent oxidoreductase [Massilia scottii]|uniref:NAD(P)/FAD-dependent oxidoreductase n=1 Tax=Massilia scottii TaxID=3057166 RepID=UPI002796771A|nr:FAD-dependent monooxygenase [Massilia sp. CCM 9029]MDQ1829143.1 FAD-dependent monooxygenase [Massilia sp. CCM 9029]
MIGLPPGRSTAQWDVVIVGAGPAGAALARRLRPQYRVLLLDRARAAGASRIGESLPGAARVLLQRQGIYERFLAQGHALRGASVSQWDSDTPAWFDPIRDPHGVGWHLDRVLFDAGLRDGAVEAGVALVDTVRQLALSHEGGRWRIDAECLGQGGATPSRGMHQTPVLVDASGRSMAAARQLGLARRGRDRLVCLYAHLPVDTDDKDQATRVCADANGWWYSVRVPSGQRVLAFHLDSDDAGLKALRDPQCLLAKAQRHGLLAAIRPATMDFPVHLRPAGGGGLDPGATAALPDGFFAIGDAMLAFDPIASQGLFNALATADSCAHAIGRYLDGVGNARERYLEELRAVEARYCQRLGETYAAVTRYARERFWLRRSVGSAGAGGFAV